MVATIAITNEVPYGGQLLSVQSRQPQQPKEGPRQVPVSMNWLVDAIAPNYAITFNLIQSTGIQPITQIAALAVDNLSCDADVFVYFPDTQQRITIPAATCEIWPVFTNGLRFIAYAPEASTGDQTFMQILNFTPPPVAIARTQFITSANSGSVAIGTATSNTTLFTGSGDLTAFSITWDGATASGVVQIGVHLTDGVSGTVLWGGNFTVDATGYNPNGLFSMSGLQIPFDTSIVLNITPSNNKITAGDLFANVYVSPKGM
jgi:hypothetical protein